MADENNEAGRKPDRAETEQEPIYSTPLETMRDGRVKGTIWKRVGEHGPFLTGSVASVYQDQDGNLQDGNSFRDTDILKLSEMSRRMYMRMIEMKRDIVAEQREQPLDKSHRRGPSHER